LLSGGSRLHHLNKIQLQLVTAYLELRLMREWGRAGNRPRSGSGKLAGVVGETNRPTMANFDRHPIDVAQAQDADFRRRGNFLVNPSHALKRFIAEGFVSHRFRRVEGWLTISPVLPKLVHISGSSLLTEL